MILEEFVQPRWQEKFMQGQIAALRALAHGYAELYTPETALRQILNEIDAIHKHCCTEDTNVLVKDEADGEV